MGLFVKKSKILGAVLALGWGGEEIPKFQKFQTLRFCKLWATYGDLCKKFQNSKILGGCIGFGLGRGGWGGNSKISKVPNFKILQFVAYSGASL